MSNLKKLFVSLRHHELSRGLRVFLLCAVLTALVLSNGASLLAEDIDRTATSTTLSLSGYTAEVSGPKLQRQRGCLKYWHNVESAASWKVSVTEPCFVEVEIVAAVQEPFDGSSFEVHIGEQTIAGKMPNTGDWENYQSFSLGAIRVEAGDHTLRLQPTELPNASLVMSELYV